MSGVGLMCKSPRFSSVSPGLIDYHTGINNVGLIAQSLYAKNIPVYDEVDSFKFQTLQVSAVSVMNCVGRIFIGELVRPS